MSQVSPGGPQRKFCSGEGPGQEPARLLLGGVLGSLWPPAQALGAAWEGHSSVPLRTQGRQQKWGWQAVSPDTKSGTCCIHHLQSRITKVRPVLSSQEGKAGRLGGWEAWVLETKGGTLGSRAPGGSRPESSRVFGGWMQDLQLHPGTRVARSLRTGPWGTRSKLSLHLLLPGRWPDGDGPLSWRHCSEHSHLGWEG